MSPDVPTNGHGEKLTRKQEQAIAALISAQSIGEAAKICGVNEKTLDRWLQLPAFAQALADAKKETLEAAIEALQAASSRFVAVLITIAEDVTKPTAARVTACRAGLEMAIRGREMIEIEARLTAIEQAQQRETP